MTRLVIPLLDQIGTAVAALDIDEGSVKGTYPKLCIMTPRCFDDGVLVPASDVTVYDHDALKDLRDLLLKAYPLESKAS